MDNTTNKSISKENEVVICNDCGRTVDSSEFFHVEYDKDGNYNGGLCESCYRKKYAKKCKKCGEEYFGPSYNRLCPKCKKVSTIQFFVGLTIISIIIFVLILSISNCSSGGGGHPHNDGYKNGVDRYVNDEGFRKFVDGDND